VRALLIRTARAAMGGTAPALLTRVCAGILASSQAGRMSARAFVASDERVVDLDCR
jgi:hypothetical protein